ncbi:single-stranded DNA-binding protein [Candidatus Peregrinibacteria bacterium]|nr:single-stranded DNA-binding protein [Candidatus Peregrinibacteria bacterium]
MRSVNKVILIGNLTRDPEMRQTANGQTVTTFCVATNREWITKDSSKHNLAEYHDIVAWARLAEICSRYLKKGKLVYIEGYLKTRSWDTPEGVKKFRTEVVAQDMIILEKRQRGEEEYIPEEEPEHAQAADAPITPIADQEPVEEPASKKNDKKEEEKKDIDIGGDLGL